MSFRRLLSAALCFALGVGGTIGSERVKAHANRTERMAGAPPLDAALFSRPAQPFAALESKPRIVMLGDSRIQEAERSELLGRPDVANRGISGDTTSGLLERLPESLPDGTEVCAVQIGINDLLEQNPLDQVEEIFRKMLRKISSMKRPPHVIVTPIILRGEAGGTLNARVTEMNSRLQQLTAEGSAEWIDRNPTLAPAGRLDPRWTNDSTHLNGDGYLVVAALLKPRLEQLAPAGSRGHGP